MHLCTGTLYRLHFNFVFDAFSTGVQCLYRGWWWWYVYIATRYTAFSSAVVLLIVVAYCYDTLHPTSHTTHAPAHASHTSIIGHHNVRCLILISIKCELRTDYVDQRTVCAHRLSCRSKALVSSVEGEEKKIKQWVGCFDPRVGGRSGFNQMAHQFTFDLQHAVVVLFVLCVLFVLVGSGQIGSKTQPFPLVGSGRRGCDSFHVNVWKWLFNQQHVH